MTAIFKIDQAGAAPPIPPGAWDTSRRDVQLFGVGGSVSLTARDVAVTYLWEIISEPPGSAVVLVNPATAICTANFLVTGGYLIRLTVDGGTATEDVSIRYAGIPLVNSGLCIPAFNEVDFDNSIDPLATTGTEEKLTVFYKWIDSHGTANNQVKIDVVDPLPGYLADKLVAGTHIGIAPGGPGPSGNYLEITADSDGATTTGHGDPNGVVVADLGAEYLDVDALVFYKNVNGGNIWLVIGPQYIDVIGVYVDAVNGDDVVGKGTAENPYKTLSHACTQQAAPVTLAEFASPVIFHLAPGVYPGPTTFPQRLHMTVVGNNCEVNGLAYWPIDPAWWDLWTISTTKVPVLQFVRDEVMKGMETDSSVALYPQGFRLSSGTLYAYNGNLGTGLAMPDYHILQINGVFRDGFHIFNQPAGTADKPDAPGNMKLVLRDSVGSTGIASRIVGECDRGSGMMVENAVIIDAKRSSVNMNGVCRIDQIEDCDYAAAWNVNYAGGPYDWGLICANSNNKIGGHIRNSSLLSSYFGKDSAAAAPNHKNATAIVFDRDSLLNMAAACADLSVAFVGFDATSAGAFERGWWNGYDEQMGSYTKVTIPCSVATDSWRLFEHTYNCSTSWAPQSAALSSNNRLTIELESGFYTLPKVTAFDFNVECVDVVGLGSSVFAGALIHGSIPNTVIRTGGIEIGWDVSEGKLERIQFQQSAAALDTKYCLTMKDRAALSAFKELAFTVDPDNAGTVRAVLIDPGLGAPVSAVWEDCHTVLNGFLYGGDIAGICRRCTAGDYSFAGWHGGAPLAISCAGVLEDCVAGYWSYGATDAGGSATFNGAATRCKVSGYGFGSTSGGGLAYAANCSGLLIDCENYTVSGQGSFGCSDTGDGTANATFLRCYSGHYSFGCSNNAAGNGQFRGEAIECGGGHHCFGSNPTDPKFAEFSGTADYCTATYASFGARGVFTGKARKCKATYGSFGDQLTVSKVALMDDCEATDIRAAAGQGPPGIFGGVVRNCKFLAKSGENVAVLVLNGGLGAANEDSRVFNCDFHSDTGANCIKTTNAGVFADVQMAHCRMNTSVHANVTNLLAVPYNMVDAAYNPA